jgi:ABC-type branched-subunit amino acid transport system ATPase component
MLVVAQLKKRFGGVQAVDGCNFEVASKSVTALIGPNGAGKTTVFNMVSGLVAPDNGRIIFAGNEITHLPSWKRSRLGLSRTFQLSRLFRNLTVEDNLLLALRQDDDRFFAMLRRGSSVRQDEHSRVRETMKFVGLDKDPKTPVTDLSYGQQKLFDLARALLNPHTFLMLDEPVAGVNPVLRDQLKTILHDLKARGETVLLIEHDMDFVRAVADQVIVMDQGRVLAEGKPDRVLLDERVLDAYLGSVNI